MFNSVNLKGTIFISQVTPSNQNPFILSVNESEACQAILDYYGGQIQLSKFNGKTTVNDTLKKSILTITIYRSDILDKRDKISELAPSNIAYLFCHN